MKGKLKKLFLFLLIILAITLICSGFTWSYLQSPVDSKSKAEVKVEIKKGMNSTQIGNILKQKGL